MPNLEVALGAVKSANDEIDDAQVVQLAVGVVVPDYLLLFLQLAHHLLGLSQPYKTASTNERKRNRAQLNIPVISIQNAAHHIDR